MSVNVTFRPSIEKAEGFKSNMQTDSYGNRYHVAELDRNQMRWQNGRWTIHLSHLTDLIPDALKPYVERITARESIALNTMGRREVGLYRLGRSTANLDVNSGNWLVALEGKSLRSIRMLLEGIRTGTLRPVRSYMAPQVPPAENAAELS
jgi:hypothetical protein